MSSFIHLIADYGKSDPAFSEVVHRLTYEDRAIDVQLTEVQPFSTVATGFWIEQLSCHNPAFDELLVYSNTAPRTEDTTPDRAATGGRLCYLRLANGVPIVAVDAGYNLSFVRDSVEEFFVIETAESGGQFRSRDIFPEHVAEIANGNLDSLGAERSPGAIPAPPEQTLCHVDGYGNIKTSIRASAFDMARETVALTIGSEQREVAVEAAAADVPENSIALVPGSAGGSDPYLEVFLRGGSAAMEFGHPNPGDDIRIRGG